MKICVINAPASTNLGNEFFTSGGRYLISKLFPEAEISFVEFFDSCEDWRVQKTSPFTKSTTDWIKNNDLVIFFGGCAINPNLYHKVLHRVIETGVPLILFSLGCCKYNKEEEEIARLMAEKSLLFVTRDSYVYDFIKDYDCTLNGIDSGFFANNYFSVPNECGKYVVLNLDHNGKIGMYGKVAPLDCDNAQEYYEKLKDHYDEIYIVSNNMQKHELVDDYRVLFISSGESLWGLYKNAMKVVTTRAHTTVCCLTEGTEVEYQGYMDKRALGIFENVGIDITNGEHLNVQDCVEKIKNSKENFLKYIQNKLVEIGVK